MWNYLKLSKFFNKIGNYFYYRYVECVKKRQGRLMNLDKLKEE